MASRSRWRWTVCDMNKSSLSSNESTKSDSVHVDSILRQIKSLDDTQRALLLQTIQAHKKTEHMHSSVVESGSAVDGESDNAAMDAEYLEEMWRLHANEEQMMTKHSFTKVIGSSRYRQSFASSSALDEARGSPSRASLRALFVSSATPFIAFGFLDNSIMIMCGEQIDELFGARLCLTTLASAGLGNLIADVVGVSAANAIESGVKRIPLKAPRLSSYQESMAPAVSTRFWGSVVGVSIGCILGLSPLFIRGTFFS